MKKTREKELAWQIEEIGSVEKRVFLWAKNKRKKR